MSFNFPNSPTPGQLYSPVGGYQYVYLDGVWRVVEAPQSVGTAQSRNRIVNPAMQISQENGNTLFTVGGFMADQWIGSHSSAGQISLQRVQVVTPNGSTNRIRIAVTTADTSVAAGDWVLFTQKIEGIRIADFQWGTASAKQIIIRFGWKSPAGTYSIALHNNAYDRSYIASFTVTAGQANTDTTQTFVVPGDTTGTWLKDIGNGLYLEIYFMSGSSGFGVAGWQASGAYALSGITNGMASTSNVFELFDVGLYMDPLNTGIAPPWVMPDEAEELRACQRYYENTQVNASVISATLWMSYEYKATKRIDAALTTTPALTSASGNLSGFNANHGSTINFGWTANARM